ncbi:MAG: DNA polymerase III subunit delta [Firmicutes bacterium HGW-Firmicutes-13]|nr:MAG: DNA polymerase III subunit delta [Firmicutes bacterium HGW-Firmicutes-13]
MDGIQALREIKKGSILPVYLLWGTEEFIKKKILDALKSKLIAPEMSAFNLDIFNLKKDGSLEDILSRAEAPPVLNSKRMIIVFETPYFSEITKEKEVKMIIDYLEKPASSTCLVFAASKIDKRKKSTKIMLQKNTAISCEPLIEKDLKKWINQRFRQENKSVEEKAIQSLLALVGNNLYQLDNEINKLSTYLGDENKVTENTVRALVTGSSLETNIFSLVDNIGRKNKAESLVELQSMLKQNEPPLRILTMIARQFRLLLQIKSLQKESRSKKEILSVIKLPFFVTDKLFLQADNFTFDGLARALIMTHETDIKIKTGRMEPQASLEILLAGIMTVD